MPTTPPTAERTPGIPLVLPRDAVVGNGEKKAGAKLGELFLPAGSSLADLLAVVSAPDAQIRFDNLAGGECRAILASNGTHLFDVALEPDTICREIQNALRDFGQSLNPET